MFEFIKKKIETPEPIPEKHLDDDLFNPLKVHVGGFIELKTIEDNRIYDVLTIEEWRRDLGIIYIFTDYCLSDDKGNMRILRVNPKTLTSRDIKDCDMLLMKSIYEGEYDEEIIGSVKQKEFYIDDDDGHRTVYFALDAGENGFLTQIKSVNIDAKDINYGEIRYWDFFRPATPTDLTTDDIFLFANMNEANGWITITEGKTIEQSEIRVYNK